MVAGSNDIFVIVPIVLVLFAVRELIAPLVTSLLSSCYITYFKRWIILYPPEKTLPNG